MGNRDLIEIKCILKNQLIKELILDVRYKIEKDGNIYRIKNNKLILIGCYNHSGYKRIKYKNKSLSVHRIIYQKFIGELDSSLVINHKNSVTDDNRIENLEQVTSKDNVLYGKSTKIDEYKIKEIRDLYIKGEVSNDYLSKKYSLSSSHISSIVMNKKRVDNDFKTYKKSQKKWSLDSCKHEALKYKKIYEWRKFQYASYKAAWRNGWLDDCTKHMTKKKV
jgi:hypothetical protein